MGMLVQAYSDTYFDTLGQVSDKGPSLTKRRFVREVSVLDRNLSGACPKSA